jgi:hypothetical protein
MAVPLPWIDDRLGAYSYLTDFPAPDGCIYQINFGPKPPYPSAVGAYRAQVSKMDPNTGAAVSYFLDWCDTLDAAKATCQADYDAYGPNLPPAP